MSGPPIGHPSVVQCWFRALRFPQRAKNALVFAPLALAGIQARPSDVAAAGFGFVALGFASSAGYIFNDLCDRAADRLHPKKRFRPFASGALAARAGLAAGPLVVVAAAAFAGVAAAHRRPPRLRVQVPCASLIVTWPC